jgi:hypothetical protein
MTWLFPLCQWTGNIPKSDLGHPGAFGTQRKHDIHTGVDLYVNEQDKKEVRAVESGKIVAVVDFTGINADSPWWSPTKAVLVEGKSGVVCYGEISPEPYIEIGFFLNVGQTIGKIIPVFSKDRIRKDIIDHSNYMLHIELYAHGTTEPVWWNLNEEKPQNLLDPTIKLSESVKY